MNHFIPEEYKKFKEVDDTMINKISVESYLEILDI
jgi:hypothetical protein